MIPTNKQYKAVLISDIHFNLKNLELATTSLRTAINKAQELDVPLIIAGDLNDSKAIIRGEVANSLIELFELADNERTFLLIGNHDLLSERSKTHSLNFLGPYCHVISSPCSVAGFNFIPYTSSNEEFLQALNMFPKGSLVIAHQGLQSAKMGEYVVDKSSVTPSQVQDYRIISGHYHCHQNIGTTDRKTPSYGAPGNFSYIGSPYTISFAEANDGPKGIQLLRTDNGLTQVPLYLRKHIIVERDIESLFDPIEGINPNDLLWLKLTGPATELEKLNKKQIGAHYIGHANFKLDKIPTKSILAIEQTKLTNEQVFDKLIDGSPEPTDTKQYLKQLWRDICV